MSKRGSREHPEEGEGWEVIAPVYMGWRRYADAAEAYRQSIRLLGESPKRLASYGQALVLANNGVVTEDARKALERALVLDPKLIEPRLVLIIAKEQDGQLAAAIEDWRACLRALPPMRLGGSWSSSGSPRMRRSSQARRLPPKPDAASGRRAAKDQAPTMWPRRRHMSPADRQAMIESMVQGLANRLDQKGDDLAGWLKLVRAYTVLDRKDDALKALEKAKTQFSGNADALRAARCLGG